MSRAPLGGLCGLLQIEVLRHKLFQWINETILFGAIRSRKEVFRVLPGSMTWFQLDGGPVQIEV